MRDYVIRVPAKLASTLRKWKEIAVCSDLECKYSRALVQRFSHGGGSIQIMGKRNCFPNCFDRALFRKLQQLPAQRDAVSARAHRVPLGLLMLSRGEVDAGQLQKALQAQRQSGSGYIGEWLLKLGFAHEHQIASALAAQWSCPILRAFPQHPQFSPVPFPLLEAFGMAPAYYIERTKTMYVAFAGRIEYRALLCIEEALQCHAIPCMTSTSALAGALNRMREISVRTDHYFESVRSFEEIARITSSYADTLGAENVQLTACGGFVWCRVEAGANAASLLFSRIGAEGTGLAIPVHHTAPPLRALSASAGR